MIGKGDTMAEMPALAHEIALDGDGRVAQDTRCLSCGYNLRGLSPDGRCPECGTAVGRSVCGNFLCYCEPAWVESLARGPGWVAASIPISILVGVAGHAFAASSGPTVPRMVSLAGGLVSLVGYWKLTAPDPSELEPNTTVRQVARWGKMTEFGLSLLIFGGMSLGWLGTGFVNLPESVVSFVAMVAIVAMFVHAGRLAIRIPDERLAQESRTVMWWLIIAQALGFVPAGVAMAGGIGASTSGYWALAIILIVFTAWGLFVNFGLESLTLLLRYRRAFRDCANQARLTWAANRPDGVEAAAEMP